MARTKRSAAASSAGSGDEYPAAREPKKRSRITTGSKTRPLAAQDYEGDPIDEAIPVPAAATVAVNLDQDVLTLSGPCFPDLFDDARLETEPLVVPVAAARSAMPHPMRHRTAPVRQRPERTEWCEYPELDTLEPDAPGCDGLQAQMEAYQSAVADGAIPASTNDVLVFEHVVKAPAYLPFRPSVASSLGDDGNYTGFQRAVFLEFTEILIQPTLSYKRATITKNLQWGNDCFAYKYKDDDPNKPCYKRISYNLSNVATTAEFHAITDKSFKRLEEADPYHQRAKDAKPKHKFLRKNHPYPLPFQERKLDGLTVWVLPKSARTSSNTDDINFILAGDAVPYLLRQGIRPEMMPFVRVVLRPLRGRRYSVRVQHLPHRWSVYLRVDKINHVLRSGDFGARVVIRDLLDAVGRQVGWIPNDDFDKQLGRVLFTRAEDAVHLPAPPSTRVPLDFDSLRSRRLLSWLHHRESPDHRSLSIPSAALEPAKKLIRLGPSGMYYEPPTGQFYNTRPDRLLLPPAPIRVVCEDSLVVLEAKSERCRVIIALTLATFNQQPQSSWTLPTSTARSIGDELVPSSATLVVCASSSIDTWSSHYLTSIPASRPPPLVVIRHATDFARTTLQQLQQAALVIVAREFLLKSYPSVLKAMSDCPSSCDFSCWLWSRAHTRTYCIDAKLRACTDPDFAPCPSRMVDHDTAHDHFSTLTGCAVHAREAKGLVQFDLPPALLHKIRWRRLVFDKGVTRQDAFKVGCIELQDDVRTATVDLQPLRELRAQSTVTFLGEPTSCDREGGCVACFHQTNKVYRMLGLIEGDVPPEDLLSMRAKQQLLKLISFTCADVDDSLQTGRCRGDSV